MTHQLVIVKKNKVLMHATTWMNECCVCERNQAQGATCFRIPFMGNVQERQISTIGKRIHRCLGVGVGVLPAHQWVMLEGWRVSFGIMKHPGSR